MAITPERLTDLRRRHGWATSWGIEGRLVDPDECVRLWPLLDRDVVLGGYHVPTDGLAKAVRAGEAQARRATERGARFLGGHTVTAIRTDDGRVRAERGGNGGTEEKGPDHHGDHEDSERNQRSHRLRREIRGNK